MVSDAEFCLDNNVFIETNLQSTDYDGTVYILYPFDIAATPKQLSSLIEEVAKIDNYVHKERTIWLCGAVSGGRVVVSPTGKITPYHDVRVVKTAAKKGMERAIDAGVKKPLFIIPKHVNFPDGQLVGILGALEALYQPLQLRERDNTKPVLKIGLYTEEMNEDFKKTVRQAVALENARILTRDIAGADSERMNPENVVQYVKKTFAGNSYVAVNVIEDQEVIKKEYPLLAAVSRASYQIERHRPRILELEYKPLDLEKVTETVMLVGKGVTFDTGGADIKVQGGMIGMSRDKSGAAAVAGFIKACSLIKPSHLKAVGVLCLCRNSVGEDCYVPDEILISRSGKSVKVINTDCEGRLAMADALFKISEEAAKEVNPYIYTIATLSINAVKAVGENTVAMDNHSAKAIYNSSRFEMSGLRVGDSVEGSIIKIEDLEANDGKKEDLVQVNLDKKSRFHQMAAGFLMRVSGLDEKDVKYTHLDIAGSAGVIPLTDPTAAPVVVLCRVHKVIQ